MIIKKNTECMNFSKNKMGKIRRKPKINQNKYIFVYDMVDARFELNILM
jgi:hypothetical protein